MGNPEILTDDFRRLDPRVVDAERLEWFISLGIFVAVTGLFLLLSVWSERFPGWWNLTVGAIALTIVPLLTAAAIYWPPLSYSHASYRVSDDGIEIRRGVIIRRIINVPRSRVQHTDVTQGPVERRFGLGTLHIYTAGTTYALVALPGLTHEIAVWCRDMLLPRPVPRPGDDADAV